MARFLFALAVLLFVAAVVLCFPIERSIPKDRIHVVAGVPLSGSWLPPVAVHIDDRGLASGQRMLVTAWYAAAVLSAVVGLTGLTLWVVNAPPSE